MTSVRLHVLDTWRRLLISDYQYQCRVFTREFEYLLEWLLIGGLGSSFSKNLKSSSDLKHGKDNGYQGD